MVANARRGRVTQIIVYFRRKQEEWLYHLTTTQGAHVQSSTILFCSSVWSGPSSVREMKVRACSSWNASLEANGASRWRDSQRISCRRETPYAWRHPRQTTKKTLISVSYNTSKVLTMVDGSKIWVNGEPFLTWTEQASSQLVRTDYITKYDWHGRPWWLGWMWPSHHHSPCRWAWGDKY